MQPNREDGMDISVWDEKDQWMLLMGKMRDADTQLFYSSARSGSIRKDFSLEHFSKFMATTRYGDGKVMCPRPDMSKIPEDDDFCVEINGVTFYRWEILTLINASNNHLW
tara:strand:- start:5767 stop:6096 length:330 start_codon:yes stop_codon:yes gene_type:complete